MIVLKEYKLADVVPQEELQAWKDRNRQAQPSFDCPEEVMQFIVAMAAKLGDFGQIRKFTTMIMGSELLLCDMKELKGEPIDPWTMYPLPVPHMIAVDNQSTMLTIFRRKGKQGLIDYCKAKVQGTELERTLEILNVHVFKVERPEFQRALEEILQSRQLEVLPV